MAKKKSVVDRVVDAVVNSGTGDAWDNVGGSAPTQAEQDHRRGHVSDREVSRRIASRRAESSKSGKSQKSW